MSLPPWGLRRDGDPIDRQQGLQDKHHVSHVRNSAKKTLERQIEPIGVYWGNYLLLLLPGGPEVSYPDVALPLTVLYRVEATIVYRTFF